MAYSTNNPKIIEKTYSLHNFLILFLANVNNRKKFG